TITDWTGEEFEIYGCQDKDGDGSCLYPTSKTDGLYVEPSYEAASVTILAAGETIISETKCVEAMENAKKSSDIIDAKAGSMPKNLLRALVEVDGWENAEEKIKQKTDPYTTYSKEIQELNCPSGSIVLSNSGDAKANWNTALIIARYDTVKENVKCDEISLQSTREEYVPNVLAWYRVFTENYGKEGQEGYCKSKGFIEPVEGGPSEEIIKKCSQCNSVDQCLACIDYRFLFGVFK
ncbi:MAG: hypothetical protein ABIE23_05185, partial [archaeon]